MMKTQRLATLIFLGLFAAAVGCPSASAAITVDGLVGDWGIAPGPYGNFAQWTPNPGIAVVQEDQDPAVSFLGPGSGGQPYDVEAIYFTQEGLTAYVAVVSGFPLAGWPGYAAGDVAIDFGSNGSYEFGVDTIGNCVGCTGGPGIKLYGNPTWTNALLFPVSSPYALATGTAVGNVSFGYQPSAYAANGHYAFEVGIPVSLFGSYWNGTTHDAFTVHWTMACGNDVLDLLVPPQRTVIPEPVSSTLFLVGLGALAFARRKFATLT